MNEMLLGGVGGGGPLGEFKQTQRFAELSTTTGQRVGASIVVSADGSTMVVGAPHPSGNGFIDIYNKVGSQFVQTQRQYASATASGDYFGYAIAVSFDGTMIVVGAALASGGQGRAFIYTKGSSGYTETQRLTQQDPIASAFFGISVFMSRDKSVIAIGAAGLNNTAGGVYIFKNAGGTYTQSERISSFQGSAQLPQFGSSICISDNGNMMLIGGPAYNNNYGRAWLFNRPNSSSSYTEYAVLSPSSSSSQSTFGVSVSLSGLGDRCAVGASMTTNDGIRGYGEVSVYGRPNAVNTLSQLILPPSPISNGQFGSAVLLSSDGDTLIVGSKTRATGGVPGGAVIVYAETGSGFNKTQEVTESIVTGGNEFGSAVGLTEDTRTLVVGASRATGQANETGVAYVFKR